MRDKSIFFTHKLYNYIILYYHSNLHHFISTSITSISIYQAIRN